MSNPPFFWTCFFSTLIVHVPALSLLSILFSSVLPSHPSFCLSQLQTYTVAFSPLLFVYLFEPSFLLGLVEVAGGLRSFDLAPPEQSSPPPSFVPVLAVPAPNLWRMCWRVSRHRMMIFPTICLTRVPSVPILPLSILISLLSYLLLS